MTRLLQGEEGGKGSRKEEVWSWWSLVAHLVTRLVTSLVANLASRERGRRSRDKIGWKRNWRKSHPMWSRLRIERIWSPSVQFRSSWHLNLCHWAEFVEDTNSDSWNIICDNREQQCAHQWWWWRGSQWRWPSFLFPKKRMTMTVILFPKKGWPSPSSLPASSSNLWSKWWKCGHGSKGGFEPKQLKVEAARPHFSICHW